MNFQPIITIAVVLVFGYLAFRAIRFIRNNATVTIEEVNEETTEDEKTLTDLLHEAADLDPSGDVIVTRSEDATILEKGVTEDIFRNRSTFDYTLKAREDQRADLEEPVPAKAWEDLANKPVSETLQPLTDVPAIGEIINSEILTDAPLAKAPKKAKAVEIPESKKPANAKFTDANIREIRKLYETAGHDIITLATLYNASPRTIDRIVKRQTYVQVV